MKFIIILALLFNSQYLIAGDSIDIKDTFEKDFICINGGGYFGATNCSNFL